VRLPSRKRFDTMFLMNTQLSQELERFFVSIPWVAQHFGVRPLYVWRALVSGEIKGYPIRGRKGGNTIWIMDVRDLPSTWNQRNFSRQSGENGKVG
jgi:hypothetical protein